MGSGHILRTAVAPRGEIDGNIDAAVISVVRGTEMRIVVRIVFLSLPMYVSFVL